MRRNLTELVWLNTPEEILNQLRILREDVDGRQRDKHVLR